MKISEKNIFEGPIGIVVLFMMSVGLGFQIGTELF